MVNKKFWMGILIVALIFSMTVAGCDDDSPTNDYDSSGNTTRQEPPDTPTIHSAIAISSNSVTVSWSYETGAEQYRVWYGTSFPLMSHVISYTNSTTITGLNADTYYIFEVQAGNNSGWSGSSIFITTRTLTSSDSVPTTPPNTPAISSAVANSSSSVTVTWNNITGATQYIVFYGTSYPLNTYVTSYYSFSTITGLNANTTYYFIVKAGNSAGWSGESNAVTAKTLASTSTGGTGTGTVIVINNSKYSDDPIDVFLFKYLDGGLIGESRINKGYQCTFTNVPTGVQLRVGAYDEWDYIYHSSVFTLTAGQTKTITYNGDSLSP